MSIVCPYCEKRMKAPALRAGRFTPKCSRCGQTFLLVVTLDPGPACTTAKLPAAGPEPTVMVADHDAEFSVAADAVRSIPDVPAGTEAGRAGAPVHGDEDDPLRGTLGGYRIEKELGRGGMGAVYLAHQVSLDRPVALKVMKARWASNPSFLVRFTREAYAAAQLVHHNVVQVHDIGDDRGVHFFSMEFVEGRSLGDLVRQQGPLAPEVAAGYVLQAARGLKFAHDRGMIHRDVKPDNLMLNRQGVVKVADLGLVRTPGASEPPGAGAAAPGEAPRPAGRTLDSLAGVTHVGQAMGTPSFMSPEQARDATTVDHRADVYSLGCTLYVLLTGRPVFEAATALEAMTRHAVDAPPRPERFVKEVPRALSDVTLRMIAKDPDDRYQSMDEVIGALEDFLGLHGGRAAASEDHVRTLERACKAYRAAPAARPRALALLGFFGGCAGLTFLLAVFSLWKAAAFCLGLGALTAAAYGLVYGATRRSPVFLRLRDLALSSTWAERGRVAVGGLLGVGVLYLTGLLWLWLVAGALGVGLALAMHFSLDRRLAAQRAAALEKVERLLRALRQRGLSEEALHEFVAGHAGEPWEDAFEALFGYEGKLAARSAHGGARAWRHRHASWRDPVVRALDRAVRARQQRRERRHLQRVEQKGLEARGVAVGEARRQAEHNAEAMVRKADEIKEAVPVAALVPVATLAAAPPGQAAPPPKQPPPRRVDVRDLLVFADLPSKTPTRRKPLLPAVLAVPLGGTARFTLGAALLLACLAWMNGRGLLPGGTNFDDETVYVGIWQRMQTAEPLALPVVPEVVARALSSVNAGAAGLLLLASAVWRSWRIGLLVLLGAAVMVIGPVSGRAPEVGPLAPPLACLAAGCAVMLLGFLFGRDT